MIQQENQNQNNAKHEKTNNSEKYAMLTFYFNVPCGLGGDR
jgi:hypothetical protein